MLYGTGIALAKAENVSGQKEIAETLDYDIGISFSSNSTAYARSSLSYSLTTVYTPKGTAVTVIQHDSDYDPLEIKKANLKCAIEFPDAVMLDGATQYYNCHSYAWYRSMTTNPYWMDDPAAYYTDGSYYEVTQPQVGDIICYYDAWDQNLHSGAIVSVSSTSTDLSSITVESKWGGYGLYCHAADYCPYVSAHGGTMAYVKYYHHAAHTYDQECVYFNKTYHTANCLCGHSVFSRHSVRSSQISGNTAPCMGCGAILNLNDDNYPISPNSLNDCTVGGSYLLPNGIAVISDEDMNLYLQGKFYINDELII